jgi:hypothetical protein
LYQITAQFREAVAVDKINKNTAMLSRTFIEK